jgi:hypothetical protein
MEKKKWVKKEKNLCEDPTWRMSRGQHDNAIMYINEGTRTRPERQRLMNAFLLGHKQS